VFASRFLAKDFVLIQPKEACVFVLSMSPNMPIFVIKLLVVFDFTRRLNLPL